MKNHNVLQSIIRLEIQAILRKSIIRQIIDIPSILNKQLRNKVSKKDIKLCRLIGVSGWSAYTIYDNIQDNELCISKVPLKLLTANYFNHHLYKAIQNLDLKKAHINLIYKILSRMIKTNIIDEKKILKDSDIPWKSMGVAIPAICLISKSGASNSDIYKLCQFFYHFIYSRQLSDDVRDLYEDRRNHRVTKITRLYLKTKNFKSLSARAAKEIHYHAQHSIKALKGIRCIKSESLEKFPQFYVTMSSDILKKLSAYNRTI